MHTRLLVLSILIVTVLTLSSCSVFKFTKIYASSEPGSGQLHGDVYKTDLTSYRIGTLGENWKRVKIDYGDLFYTNNKKTSAITVNSSCGPNKAKYSLSVLAGSLLVGVKGKKLIDRELIQVDGEDALFSLYDTQFEGDDIKIATVVFKKGQCIYDFSYLNINDEFDTYIKEFVEFISEFRVLD
jgi:hypothetical protein